MRDYSKVSPQFWTGRTGRALKAAGPEALVVSLYLMTCPHANMLGLYYLSKAYIAIDTGLEEEGASKGLASAIQAGFCKYDEETETVWVLNMAAFQVGEHLTANDNRCKGIQKEYDSLHENPYLSAFYERYAAAYHMTRKRGGGPEKVSPSEAPSDPLRSQEQEQEQEQEETTRAYARPEANARDEVSARCPVSEIIDSFRQHAPSLIQPRIVTDATKSHIAARWRQDEKHQSLAFWAKYFSYCEQNDFLAGRAESRPGKPPFRAGLDWVVSAGNFAKIINGNYDRQGEAA